jgi:A-macroglobulin receptor binding domain
MYFDEIGDKEICVNVNAVRSFEVALLKNTAVTVYDYYDNSKTEN